MTFLRPLFTFRHSLIILDDKGDHVFCGTAGGVYETTDAAGSWKLIPSTPFCLGLTNGTIGGVPHIICGAKAGIYNVRHFPAQFPPF